MFIEESECFILVCKDRRREFPQVVQNLGSPGEMAAGNFANHKGMGQDSTLEQKSLQPGVTRP